MVSATSGEAFEDYVAYVYQALVHCDSEDITVRRRVKIPDSRGTLYEIDVFYEFDMAGVHHRVAMECKNTQRPVERNDVMAFYAKIQDMPSTIGVFISRSGFQTGALHFLDDHGVLHFDSAQMPHLGDAIVSIIAAAALPSERSIGQPFWSLMCQENGSTTGSWLQLPEQGRNPAVFPLFISKPDASLFSELTQPYCADSVVRGLPHTTLRFILLTGHDLKTLFGLMKPIRRRGRIQFECETVPAIDVAERFLQEGASSFSA
jgi:hypothetical protein